MPMSPGSLALLLATIALLAVGQILFKQAAAGLDLRQPQTLLTGWMFTALCIYALATLAWMVVLSRVPLTVAFPFYGLTFLAVPVLAAVFLGEALTVWRMVGGAVILVGIAISVRSG